MFTLAQRLEAAERSQNDRVAAAVAADLLKLSDDARPTGVEGVRESSESIVVRDHALSKKNSTELAVGHEGFPRLHKA